MKQPLNRRKGPSVPEIVLVTGANRGIGLEVARALVAAGDTVVAACRWPDDAGDLKALRDDHPETVHVVELDVDSDESASAAAKEVAAKVDRLDALLNNAGINPKVEPASPLEINFDQMRRTFETNALGPLRVARAMLPLLRKSDRPRIVNVSSGAGSLKGIKGPDMVHYRTSKAALNMITRQLAFALKDDGITVVALSPGWVRTDMGGPNATLAPEESGSAIARTIKALDADKTSLWIDRHGELSEAMW